MKYRKNFILFTSEKLDFSQTRKLNYKVAWAYLIVFHCFCRGFNALTFTVFDGGFHFLGVGLLHWLSLFLAWVYFIGFHCFWRRFISLDFTGFGVSLFHWFSLVLAWVYFIGFHCF